MARNLCFLILSTFLAISANADVFVSIDCGSSTLSYIDNNGIVWMGDDTLIQNGQSKVVQNTNGIPEVMTTLREFTTRKKNCYSIQNDKGGQVLVRASFYYGNYDKKSAPPTFDLQFDGNFWTTVQTSLDQVMYAEVTYVTKFDSISVCLSQTQPNQFSFISALEIRSLGSEMYGYVGSNYALFLRSRIAFGSNATVRYLDDPYDRIWIPGSAGTGLTIVSNDALFIDTSIDDAPPQEVLQNAITTISTNESILLNPNFPPISVPIYLNLYFSEVTQLDSTQNRSFVLEINNVAYKDVIIPPYGGVTEYNINDTTANSSTTFSLVPTSESTLPPLINAMESFSISNPMTDGTNSKDVDGLSALQTAFSVLQGWAGDPCLPSPYTWDWLNCSSDSIPRVTSLELGGYKLSGSLPDFSSMDALVAIDIQNNEITGPIPDFLGTLPNLRELNLANNAFTGAIPTSISKNNNLKVEVSGNPDLCTSSKSCQTTTASDSGSTLPSSTGGSGKKSSKLPVILGTIIPIAVVFWIVVGVLAIMHQKRKAAVALAGNGNGPYRPNGTQAQGESPSNIIMNKIAEAVIDEIKVDVQEQLTADQSGNFSPSQPLYQSNQN